MIRKSGKGLENCERAESEEEKIGEQGRGKMLAEWADLTRDRRGKNWGEEEERERGTCGPAGGHASPHGLTCHALSTLPIGDAWQDAT
jgi:hypothetical protein